MNYKNLSKFLKKLQTTIKWMKITSNNIKILTNSKALNKTPSILLLEDLNLPFKTNNSTLHK